jgi:hypothetical protein
LLCADYDTDPLMISKYLDLVFESESNIISLKKCRVLVFKKAPDGTREFGLDVTLQQKEMDRFCGRHVHLPVR